MHWQPIETAPRDGTTVDLWIERLPPHEGAERVVDCRFERGGWQAFDNRFDEWYDVETGDPTIKFKATHWLLPTPPAA